jgi:hypothetical protein
VGVAGCTPTVEYGIWLTEEKLPHCWVALGVAGPPQLEYAEDMLLGLGVRVATEQKVGFRRPPGLLRGEAASRAIKVLGELLQILGELKMCSQQVR